MRKRLEARQRAETHRPPNNAATSRRTSQRRPSLPRSVPGRAPLLDS
jgi:hypothetical protein